MHDVDGEQKVNYDKMAGTQIIMLTIEAQEFGHVVR